VPGIVFHTDGSLLRIKSSDASLFADAGLSTAVTFPHSISDGSAVYTADRARLVIETARGVQVHAETVRPGLRGSAHVVVELTREQLIADEEARGVAPGGSLPDGSVTLPKLAPDVTAQLGGGGSGPIADGSVTTAKLAAGAVTEAKIADGTISLAKLGSDVTSQLGGGGGGVPAARTITAGTGLTGGGDLSADRTLAVNVGTTAGTVAAGDDARITGAAQKWAVSTKTTAHTAVDRDLLLVDATSGPVTITLPAPSAGLMVTAKKIDASANAVTIVPTSGTIDGAASQVLSAQYVSRDFVASASAWYQI